MTGNGSISEETLNEIGRLNPNKVYILGGPNSVSPSVEKVIQNRLSSSANTMRISGANRYETSIKIAEEIVGKDISNGAGFVNGSSDKFPDALSAAALLGVKNMPLILTDGKSMPSGSEKYKTNSKNYIIGGVKSINISNLAGKRLSGANRYSTSSEVASEGFKDSLYDSNKQDNKFNSCVVVDGRNYPDALTSISIAKKENAPILLVDHSIPSPILNYIDKEKRDKAYIIGGSNSVSIAVQNSLIDKLSENHKINNNNENTDKKNALRDLERTMNKFDDMLAMMSQNSKNKSAIESYKSLKNQIYDKYVSKGINSLDGVSSDLLKQKNDELEKKFDEIMKISDSQYNDILKSEIDKGLEKISDRGVILPEDKMNSSQKSLHRKLKSATSLLSDSNKNREKLELALEIRDFDISSGGSSSSNALIKEANELLSKASDIRTESQEFISKERHLNFALKDAENSSTTSNLNALKEATEDFKYVYNAYNALEERVKKAEKLLTDKRSVIDYRFKSKEYKDFTLEKDKENLEEEIKNSKTLLNDFKNRSSLTNKEWDMSKLIDSMTNKIRNFEEIRNGLDSTIKKCEDTKFDDKKVESIKVEIKEKYNKLLSEAKDLKNKGDSLNINIYDEIRELNNKLNDSYKEYKEAYDAVK